MATRDPAAEDPFLKMGQVPDDESGLSPAERMVRDRYASLGPWRRIDPMRNIHNASEHIEALLEKIGLQGEIEEQKLRQAWIKVAGEFIAQHAQPESLKRGVLTVTLLQKTVHFHLEQMKGKLLKNLREELGEDVVKSVRFKVG